MKNLRNLLNCINILVLFVILVLLYSCTTKTVITMPNERIYTVKSKSDALVTLKKDGEEMIVDNRGKPSALMQILSMLFVRAPEVVDAGD